MKIDSNKSGHQNAKESTLNASNKVNLVQSTANSNNLTNTNNSHKNFASILNEAGNVHTEKFIEKNSDKNINQNNLNESENESKQLTKVNKEKVEQDQKHDRNSSDSKDSKEENSFAQIFTNDLQRTYDIENLSAKSIIHVADLERIISTIRSQSVANGKQVTIELNRSILSGLKLKLIIGKDKSVIAELIASNEKVISQLNSKSEELANILKTRGIKLIKLGVSLDSDTNKRDDRGNRSSDIIGRSTKTEQSPLINETKDVAYTIDSSDSDTSYQI